MDADANAQRTGDIPRFGVQGALRVKSGVERVSRASERGVEAVAGRLHDITVV